MKMTATELRANLFHSLDHVLETGEPIEINRHGKIILITTPKPRNRLDNLIKRSIVLGDDEEIVSMDWSKEWHSDLP